MKQDAGTQKLLSLLQAAVADGKVKSLLDFLLTEQEKEQLATRVLLSEALLKADKPQRQIAKELGVSIVKITRGSNYLKTISPSFKAYLLEKLHISKPR